MRNRLYYLNNERFSLLPKSGQIASSSNDVAESISLLRLLILTIPATLTGIGLAWLISYLLPLLTNLVLLGKIGYTYPDPEDSGLGFFLVLVPVAGAVIWLLFRHKQKLLNATGLTTAVATGAPLGTESPVWLAGMAVNNKIADIAGMNTTARNALRMAAIAAGFAWCFGTPVAAFMFAAELLMAEITLAAILPVVTATLLTAVAQYFLHPVNYNVRIANVNDYTLYGLYLIVGVVSALLGALVVKCNRWLSSKGVLMAAKSKWWLLFAAVITGVCCYYYPEMFGSGEQQLIPLLNGAVTLKLIFLFCFVKLFMWVVYSALLDTGAGVISLFLIGAAWGLLTGFIFQVSFPGIHVDPAVAAIAGMLAFFTGTTRAVFTALIMGLEISHAPALLPMTAIACTSAYLISRLLPVTKKKAIESIA
ncbi:chloride channel protein [Chitinophaga sp. Cy-1792]|uniref:chloride channel protein n=1 Tax=Chitinophaga sp. Cy-1792 TaxID=2608339 RepID=UPI00141EFB2E|nr:chloride channel protein [Chitinophaga sp. Cy-1792]NIG52644.1 chloride channel protein [Chitinophaga sp. Cy-1792]